MKFRRTAFAALLMLPCLGADECHDVKGVKVFLSPANHGGGNIGCNGFNEDDGAWASAQVAAQVLGGHGYVVKVGTGNYEANFNESNAWGADVHVPVHSNAGAWGCQEDSPANLGGTWAMYRTEGSTGQQLAADILESVGPVSPGTNDKLDRRTDLLELKTQARAAYAEMGFHTYYWDVVWMAFDANSAGRALAAGIHKHCLVVGCKNAGAAAADEPLELTARRAAAEFDLVDGEPRPEIVDALSERLWELDPALADAVVAVTEVDGVLVVELHDIRHLGTGHQFWAAGIPRMVFALTELDELVFTIEGESAPFCEWTESDCLALARE
ncbi:N-acetylmuramoyl-L-alanine amidase [Nannocystis sp. SCPEA4]|uniref:N-acetylmuramoyl-L-alanine amidase n=1 Tax=Nannocystis sp. SCPEA4 TaxID=2996787 RepID=UPI00226FF49F|nr:N-acetylmuramoyl-L-alanine amidase [Nannocystis sp. SCPEA4]MCY1059117.1 N-acetylmuramoyl-L-alanine amidase [Nannocystis sp. SCPEA4]